MPILPIVVGALGNRTSARKEVLMCECGALAELTSTPAGLLCDACRLREEGYDSQSMEIKDKVRLIVSDVRRWVGSRGM